MYPVISSYLHHKKQAILRKTWNKHRFFYFSLLKKYVMIIIQNVRWAWIV